MANLSQSTFVDRINEAEIALNELSYFASRLASRLVGQAGADNASNDGMPLSSGILHDVDSAASRMIRAAGDIRTHLRRIEESLPVEAVITSTGYSAESAMAGIARSRAML